MPELKKKIEDLEHNTLKKDVYEALSEVEGADTRVMLTMMARMIDVQDHAYADIISLIDRRFNDVKAMQQLVLNGNAETHHEDHEYLKDVRVMLQGFQPALELATERIQYGGYCDYADRMLREEARMKLVAETDAEKAKEKRAQMKYDLLKQVGLVVGAIVLYTLTPDLWAKLHEIFL